MFGDGKSLQGLKVKKIYQLQNSITSLNNGQRHDLPTWPETKEISWAGNTGTSTEKDWFNSDIDLWGNLPCQEIGQPCGAFTSPPTDHCVNGAFCYDGVSDTCYDNTPCDQNYYVLNGVCTACADGTGIDAGEVPDKYKTLW